MRIGVDIGGTFTDLACIDDAGALHTAKTPSTPDDPSIAVIEGLEELAAWMELTLKDFAVSLETIVHGTTVTTNDTRRSRTSGRPPAGWGRPRCRGCSR